MGKIQRLKTDLANQIAAGEVVERPASVVKELVENAIDAGASRIRVELEQGGLSRIVVTDDGEGMDSGDAELALERHATSKIRALDDLMRIRSFGFRGEALPSIASVAKLTLRTRTRDAAEGVEVNVEGGGKATVRPAGSAPGTTIDIRELFFNVPARRKFLKAQATEAAHAGEAVVLAALSRPEVTFTLVRDGKVAREYLRANTAAERAAQIFPDESLEICAADRTPFRIEAHLAAPERARAGAGGLYLFVNRRPVKDRQLARAVAHSYGSVIEPGRYPVGVVYIELPHEQVDVNVHPQKAEVRFTDARGIFEMLARELHRGLARAFSIPALGPIHRPWIRPNSANTVPSSLWNPPPSDARDGLGSPSSTNPPGMSNDPWGLTPAGSSFGVTGPLGSFAPYDAASSSLREEPALFGAGLKFYARLRFIAQVRSMFLLCEGDDALYVLDQHAAAERITFDRLRKQYQARSVATQQLLIPEVVSIGNAEVAALEHSQEDALRVGLDLRPVGHDAIAVHAVPKLLLRASAARIARDFLAEASLAAKRPFSDAADLVLATMACHGSIRAGDSVSAEEARALLDSLDGIDFSGHCPHGRPVVTRIGYDELERRVGR